MAYYKYNVATLELLEVSDFDLSPGDNEATSQVEGLTKLELEAQYTWENGEFTLLPKRILTKKEFLKRLTPVEYVTIKTAALQNPYLDYYWQLFMLAEHIDLADFDTVQGIYLLAQAGLIQPERPAEILGG